MSLVTQEKPAGTSVPVVISGKPIPLTFAGFGKLLASNISNDIEGAFSVRARISHWIVKFCAVVFSVSALVNAVAEAGQGRRIALVIGNSSYKESPLGNPANDARDVALKLRKLGFDVIQRIDASQKEMNRAITEFGDRLNADTVALFYYAGHGVQVRGKNYLIPVDAQISGESSVRAESVDVDTVLDQLAGSDLNIVILDACRNNPFERRFRSLSGGLAQMDAPKGSLIAYATAPGKTAIDGTGRNGLYTQELLKQLDIVGQPVEAVFKNVRRAVARATSDQQVPWESSSLTGDFYFNAGVLPSPQIGAQAVSPITTEPPQASSGPAQFSAEDELWRAALSAGSVEAFQMYLAEFPNGRYASAAKIKLGTGAGTARPQVAPAISEGTSAAIPSVAEVKTQGPDGDGSGPASAQPKQAESAPDQTGNGVKPMTTPDTSATPPPAAKTQAPVRTERGDSPRDQDGVPAMVPQAGVPAPTMVTSATLGDRIITGRFTVEPNSNAVTGKVLVRWRDGVSFEGEMVADKRTGPGILINRQGSRIEATWSDDRIAGAGTMVFVNGDRYQGEFKNDQAEGKGVYTTATGDLYEGAFRAGERHGNGRITWTSGNYWEGQFAAGKQVFRGAMMIKAGDQLMSGEFDMDPVSGKVSGRGSTVWANGDRYDGDFVSGVKQGQGVFSWANGERFEGEWRDDRPNGTGRAVFANGERYEGEVKDGVPHGKGTYFWPSGGYYTGAWVAGKKHGKGHLSLTGSNLIEVEYRDDEPVERTNPGGRRGG